MNNFLHMFFKQRMVGIDIGTSAIKMVEVSGIRHRRILENYAEVSLKDISVEDKKDGMLSPVTTAQVIKEMIRESNIKAKKAIFSIPDFSTFCTSFEIPPMPKEEIPGAISFNAAQYITLPISQVTLDWQVAAKNPLDKNSPLVVFLVAIPNQVIEDYKLIAKNAGLQLYALEAEVISIKRALARDVRKTICLVDIGFSSSTISVLDQGFLKESYSFEFNSSLMYSGNNLGDVTVLAKPLLQEIQDVCSEFLEQEKHAVDEIYITGGGAQVPGLKDFLQQNTKKSVSAPNGFLALSYNPILEMKIGAMSSRFSAALGASLSGLEG